MERKEIIFYCFKDGFRQKSNVIKCENLQEAHNLFDVQYVKYKNGVCEWDYFDITVNGKLLRSSKF
jgi:hypothetical protein